MIIRGTDARGLKYGERKLGDIYTGQSPGVRMCGGGSPTLRRRTGRAVQFSVTESRDRAEKSPTPPAPSG